MTRTMYAVVQNESFIDEAIAFFDDVTHAEIYAEQETNDIDRDGTYIVVPVTVKTAFIEVQTSAGDR
jgi:hypothetical protein